jgi:hypothetical protein
MVIGIGVAIVIVACLVGAQFLLRRSPYDDMVSRLRPGMHSFEVTGELGESYTEVRLDFGSGGKTLMYTTKDKNWPLFIQFTNYSGVGAEPDTIDQWCGVPWDRSRPDKAADLTQTSKLELVCHKVR